MRGLGQRMRSYFPALLGQDYFPNRYNLVSTQVLFGSRLCLVRTFVEAYAFFIPTVLCFFHCLLRCQPLVRQTLRLACGVLHAIATP